MLFYFLVLVLLRFTYYVTGTSLPRFNPGDSGLASRGYPANSITGYPATSDCSGSDHYTWDDISFGTCYEYWDSSTLETMNSIKVTDFSEAITITSWAGDGCSGDFVYTYAAAGEDICVQGPMQGFSVS
jgi:hypothetical protein